MKIRAIDFAAHSDAELNVFFEGVDAAQIERIQKAIATVEALKAEQAKTAMREELNAIAAKYGVGLNEALTGIKSGGKVAPKYRNPANPSETWTGRGRNPEWVTAYKAAHNDDLTGCLIEAPATVE